MNSNRIEGLINGAIEGMAAAADPAYVPTPRGKPISKVERYGWEVRDQPGEFRWVDKRALRVDPEYQRPEQERKVLRIAGEWSWLACGVLGVAERDRDLYVFDGNHRVLAAMRRSDIDRLPCLVFRTESSEQEAQGFLHANIDRRPLDTIDRFKAQVVVDEPGARMARDLLAASGYEISKYAVSGKTIKCIGSLVRWCIAEPDVVLAMWPTIIAAAEGEPIYQRPMEALFFIEKRLRTAEDQPVSLTRKPWNGRVVAMGMKGMQDAANKAVAFFTASGPKVWACGVVEALNKGCRNRLVVPGMESGT